MKKKNIFILVGIIGTVLVLVGCCYILYNGNNDKIVRKDEYIGYSFSLEGKINYYINNGNHFIAFNKKTHHKLFEFEMPQFDIKKFVNSDNDIIHYYTIKEDNEYKLFNIYGIEIKKSSSLIKIVNDMFNNKSYYFYEGDLYNENDEIIFEGLLREVDDQESELIINVYGSYIYVQISGNLGFSAKLINLKDNQVISVDSYNCYDNYVKFYRKDSKNNTENIYILDKIKDELTKYSNYEEKSYGAVVYNDENDMKLLVNSEIVNYGEKIRYHDYKFEYTVCEDGFQVYTRDDKLISNECYKRFREDVNGIIYLDVTDYHTVYLKDNKIYFYIPVGQFFVKDYFTDVNVYNEKGEEKSTECQFGFNYYKDDFYVCKDYKNSYLINKKFNKVTEDYDSITCDKVYCYMEKDGKYGLLYNNQVIVHPFYEKIYFIDNAILAEDGFKIDIFTIGKDGFLSSEELNQNFNEYKSIDIDEIVEMYELDSIKKILENDSELFKKYAFIVNNNVGLNGYEKYVLESFKLVSLNNQYLSEDDFLYSLKTLSFQKNEFLSSVGEYDPLDNSIVVKYDDEITIFHELTHFIDFNLNNHDTLVYQYKNEYISIDEYNLLQKEEISEVELKGNLEFNFLIEGGAEVNSGIYLRNNLIHSYFLQVQIYNMFNYIYGEEVMSEVYFGRNGHYLFFQKLVDAGYNFEEIKEFERTVNRFSSPTNQELITCLDMIINIYEQNIQEPWYEDEIFSYFVGSILPNLARSHSTKRYDEYKKINTGIVDDVKNILNKLGNKYSDESSVVYVLYHNKNLYFTIKVSQKSGANIQKGNLIVNYDIKSQIINNYQFVAL